MEREHLIAVIDDDESFRMALVASLGSLGYAVRGYASAQQFLAEGGDGLCDCIITDLHMPGMSGLDLIQQLAAKGSKPPVIMITGRPEHGLAAKAATGGAVCLLSKPFDTDTLIECIKKALKI